MFASPMSNPDLDRYLDQLDRDHLAWIEHEDDKLDPIYWDYIQFWTEQIEGGKLNGDFI